MGIYLPNMEMPKNCEACELAKHFDGYQENDCPFNAFSYYDCPLIPVPPHGRLIDANALRAKMYHEAFETDTPMQKWDSGCWIRYKMFEDMEESAPTVIPASEEEVDEAQRDYERAVEDQRYCEMYEPTYDPETGAM